MTIGEKSKPVAFLSPPGRQGKQWSKRRDSRKQPVRAPKKAETTLSHHKSPVAALPPGPPASGFMQSIWALPSPSTGCACPPDRQHSRDAGVALLTRVELGWGGQSPGGGQGGLRTQRARQVGRCSTWTGGGQTDTSELVHSSLSFFGHRHVGPGTEHVASCMERQSPNHRTTTREVPRLFF